MAKPKTNNSWSGKWWLWVLLLIVVLAIGYKTYDHFTTAANRRAFQNARTAIDNIYYESVKQIGSADNAQVNSSCKRDHVEFSSGKLSCNVGIDFIYSVEGEPEANQKMAQLQKIVSHSELKLAQPLSTTLKDRAVASSVYHTASDSYTIEGLDCVVTYIFNTPQSTSLSITNPAKLPLEVSVGCYGPAKQQYYRLAS